GYVALAFARRHPDRLAGLILADTKAEADDAAGRANRDAMIALAREKGAAAVVEKMLPKLLGDATRAAQPELVERVRGIGCRQPVDAMVAAFEGLRDRPDATPGLDRISVYTLVLVGEQDTITPPAAAEAMAARIPG